MSGTPACGRDDCPVPATRPAGLRTVVLPAGTRLRHGYRRSHPDPTGLVPGRGDTRFAPLVDDVGDLVSHVHLAQTTFAALLESVLHDAAPPSPRVRRATLARWAEAEVALTCDVRLFDLRDTELERHGIARAQLVSTDAIHYRCTRAWAGPLRGRSVGGHQTHGLIWQSRQRELHAAALDDRPALRDLVSLHPADVAVVWSPPAPDTLLDRGEGLGPLHTGAGLRYLLDLTSELGILVM